MNATSAQLPDNPCWGGPDPQQHSLDHLLNVLGGSFPAQITSESEYSSFIERIHQNLIVFQDENYLVVNKPADLRMDGDYAASMHKLLLYLFPPDSLLAEPKGPAHHTMLLEKIAPLSNHSCLNDDPFRIVHQLDYATSGILLYAKNRKAAGAACKSFQDRQTNKKYVAVVVNSNEDATEIPLGADFIQSLPVLPLSCLSEWSDGSLENRYRKKRKRETDDRESKKNTFDGFMPVHSVFAKWRGSLHRLKKGQGCEDGKQPSKPRKKKPHDDLPPLPEPEIPLTSEEIDEVLSYGQSWKNVKSSKQRHSRCWVTVVETMAKEYNQSLEKFYAGKNQPDADDGNDQATSRPEKTDSTCLPPLFRVQSQEDKVDDSFYICAAIGEPKDGRFEVLVDPACKVTASNQKKKDAEQKPDMRPSLTKCTILWRGNMKVGNGSRASIPVTKVLLKPWTGRRHQLRVHLAHVAGYPILGDVAYGGNMKIKCNADRVMCPRMCLHAKQLTIPLLEGNGQTFEAPDPFVVKKFEHQEDLLEVL